MPEKLTFQPAIKCFFLLAAVVSLFSVSAQKTVTGRITNSNDKLPIPSATVQVKGTKTFSLTNENGSFSINVPSDNSILQLSVVGYEKLELAVSGKTDIGEIAMVPAPTSLNDVVVTGYSTQRKKDITGAVAVINVNNMKAVPSGTVESLLQGQAAGVR